MKNRIISIILFLSVTQGNAQTPSGILSKQETDSLILGYCKVLNKTYFNQSLSKEITTTLKKKLKAGDFYNVTQLTDRLSLLLQDITKDIHFYVGLNQPEVSNDHAQEAPVEEAENKNGGFAEVRILEGKVGYIKWNEFIADEQSFQKAIAMLQFVQGSKYLIFDLSECDGGDGRMGSFINRHLFESDDYQNALQKRCTDKKEWHQSEVPYHYTNGPKLYDVPVFIIVSNHTASAAEYFALIIKEMKRGVVLGSKTVGAGNPVVMVTFGNYFAYIPVCEIVTQSGKSIEGRGVEPDVALTSNDWVQETITYIKAHR